MESCTGGYVVKLLTDISGSSEYVRGSIVTYATDLKKQFGVTEETIQKFGVISSETALEMAGAIRKVLQTDVGIGITGVAGPSLQEGKPAGKVHIGIVTPQVKRVFMFQFKGNRNEVREQAAYAALEKLQEILS